MNTNCTKWPVANGNWTSPSTWNGGTLPGNNDIVCIPAGFTVTVVGNTYKEEKTPAACQSDPANSPRLYIFICGNLNFDPSGKLYLSCGSTIEIYPGGRVQAAAGSSDLIQIGHTLVWGGPGSGQQSDLNGPYYVTQTGQGAGVLPVVMGEFKAEAQQPSQILLQWTTYQEYNSAEFLVERSADSKVWISIGSIKAAGNSSVRRNYTFTDRSPLNGNNYYRLKQVDIDGKAAYSGIVRVSNNHSNHSNISIFPNPVQATANIYVKNGLKGTQQIQVFNNSGVLIQTMNAVAGNMMQLDTRNLASGYYWVRLVESGRTLEQTRLIKQ